MATENKTVKITKAMRFADILAMINGDEVPMLNGVPRTSKEDALEFIAHEVELLSRKNTKPDGSKKPTENQLANEKYKALILDFMADREPMTCTAIGQSIPELADPAKGFGTSKYTSLCTALVNEGKLRRQVVKGKALFSIAD